jgi:hypothetical protein
MGLHSLNIFFVCDHTPYILSVSYVVISSSQVAASSNGDSSTTVLMANHQQWVPKSKLLYDWRFTAHQFVLATSPLRLTTSNACLSNILSEKRMGPRQCSYSQVRLLRDSWPHFTVSNSRLPQPRGPGPRIYIPQEQVGPVMTPGTWFPFRRLLRLAGPRWRYSTAPPLEASQSQSYVTTG